MYKLCPLPICIRRDGDDDDGCDHGDYSEDSDADSPDTDDG
ncbi:MAG: hypothetical protein US33_C0006G0015 [Parcubacteria group bacterium GW2011_GWC1_36_9]|nr:MAG: hypothetical protein US33_C0006G0015 [Parcubacteria group bacterium GW2011_GWC1_36_9]